MSAQTPTSMGRKGNGNGYGHVTKGQTAQALSEAEDVPFHAWNC